MAINFKKTKNQANGLENNDTYQSEKGGFSLANGFKKADESVEEFAFGGVENKLKIVAKVILYIFMVLGLFGIILTALLTSSLGGVGVLVALLAVAVFVFLGYALSAVIYGYASVVEKSKKSETAIYPLNFQPQITEEKKVDKQETVKDEEFPEF